jgi:hypothetical protein
LPPVFLQPSWYSPHFSPPAISHKFPCPLFSPKPLARISLPPSHLTLGPSALPCPVLFLPSYDSHSPAPRPQHPRLSGGSTPPAFCLGIHSQSAAILLACTMMQPSLRCPPPPLPGVSCRTPSCLAPTCTHCTTCTPSPSSAPAYAMASPWPPGL